jgi:hypothetical protein
MNPAISANQFNSRYSQAVAARSATVNAIFTNSPMKNDIGLAPSSFCAFEQPQRKQAVWNNATQAAEQRRPQGGHASDQTGEHASDDRCRELQKDQSQHAFPLSFHHAGKRCG